MLNLNINANYINILVDFILDFQKRALYFLTLSRTNIDSSQHFTN